MTSSNTPTPPTPPPSPLTTSTSTTTDTSTPSVESLEIALLLRGAAHRVENAETSSVHRSRILGAIEAESGIEFYSWWNMIDARLLPVWDAIVLVIQQTRQSEMKRSAIPALNWQAPRNGFEMLECIIEFEQDSTLDPIFTQICADLLRCAAETVLLENYADFLASYLCATRWSRTSIQLRIFNGEG